MKKLRRVSDSEHIASWNLKKYFLNNLNILQLREFFFQHVQLKMERLMQTKNKLFRQLKC